MKNIFAFVIFLALPTLALAGTWGAGSFDSDQALDTSSDWAESGNVDAISQALKNACAADYLEAPDAENGVVAAEVVAAALGRPNPRLPADLFAWLERQPKEQIRVLESSARSALACVRDPGKSELYELWAEQDNSEWLGHMDDLAARLRVGLNSNGP